MKWNKRAYFDYASATPLDKRVVKAMKPYLAAGVASYFANASSLYKEGVAMGKALAASRKTVASVLQSKPDEIIFTAGGTEANNMAILGTYFHHKNVLKKEIVHFVTTTIEHSSVLEAFRHLEILGALVTYVSPESNGLVNAKDIEIAITEETVLVSVMYANNEIGTIQPIREIGKIIKALKEKGQQIAFHVDACQAALYLPVLVRDLYADFLVLDGSKIYGPKGVGILYKKRNAPLSPIMFGGGQEAGLRPGTENVADIVGFAEALRIADAEREKESVRLSALRDDLINTLLSKIPALLLNGDPKHRLANNINVCKPGLDAEYAVLRLDVLGFSLSSVTTCKNVSEDVSSYVVEELYRRADGGDACSKSSLRITLGRFTAKSEVQNLVRVLVRLLS